MTLPTYFTLYLIDAPQAFAEAIEQGYVFDDKDNDVRLTGRIRYTDTHNDGLTFLLWNQARGAGVHADNPAVAGLWLGRDAHHAPRVLRAQDLGQISHVRTLSAGAASPAGGGWRPTDESSRPISCWPGADAVAWPRKPTFTMPPSTPSARPSAAAWLVTPCHVGVSKPARYRAMLAN